MAVVGCVVFMAFRKVSEETVDFSGAGSGCFNSQACEMFQYLKEIRR